MIGRKLTSKQASHLSFLSFITFLTFLLAPAVSASNYESMGGFYGGFFKSLWDAFINLMSLNWLKSPEAYIAFMRFLIFIFIFVIYEEIFKYAHKHMHNFPISQRSGMVLSVILSIITIIFIPAGMLAEFGSQYGFIGLVILWLPVLGILGFVVYKTKILDFHANPPPSNLERIIGGLALFVLGMGMTYLGYVAVYTSSYWESNLGNIMPSFIPFTLLKIFRRKKHV